jgi:hypothetical protein
LRAFSAARLSTDEQRLPRVDDVRDGVAELVGRQAGATGLQRGVVCVHSALLLQGRMRRPHGAHRRHGPSSSSPPAIVIAIIGPLGGSVGLLLLHGRECGVRQQLRALPCRLPGHLGHPTGARALLHEFLHRNAARLAFPVRLISIKGVAYIVAKTQTLVSDYIIYTRHNHRNKQTSNKHCHFGRKFPLTLCFNPISSLTLWMKARSRFVKFGGKVNCSMVAFRRSCSVLVKSILVASLKGLEGGPAAAGVLFGRLLILQILSLSVDASIYLLNEVAWRYAWRMQC